MTDMKLNPRHEITIRQGERFATIVLTHGEMGWLDTDAEGRWRQLGGDESTEGLELHRGFKSEDRKRLVWYWENSQYGGLIEIGVMVPTEDHKRGKYEYFRRWFSLRGAKLLTCGKFRVAGVDHPGGDGEAIYELAGSSDTFQNGKVTWSLTRYSQSVCRGSEKAIN